MGLGFRGFRSSGFEAEEALQGLEFRLTSVGPLKSLRNAIEPIEGRVLCL